VFIGAKQGFIHFDPSRYAPSTAPFRVVIRAVRSLGGRDSLLYGNTSALPQPPRFDSDWRAFRFACAVPGLAPGSHVQYSYSLEGLEKGWSDWTDKPEKDYTNLPPGDFVFRVRARNAHGQISEIAIFSFRIATPWYLTLWAKAMYLLLAGGLLAGLFLFMRRRHAREKRLMVLRQQRELRMLEQTYKLEAGEIEQELLQMRNERLQNEITYKNQELAASAMHLVQKGSILATLKDALNEVAKATEEARVKQEVKRIIRNIEQDIALDNHWEQFSYHFDQVHNQFLRALQEAYPVLTGKDLKVCAYLRMGLSTKEVAALMNISVRGMEISRYRLRKKLNIPHEEGIIEFLVAFNERLEESGITAVLPTLRP
jgi:DNA-binding CsgD family transcriptional regulator